MTEEPCGCHLLPAKMSRRAVNSPPLLSLPAMHLTSSFHALLPPSPRSGQSGLAIEFTGRLFSEEDKSHL